MILRPSPSFDARPEGAGIDILILHYTGMRSAAAALARLCDPAAKVSAHYLIDEDGSLYRLVEERFRAWHAGVSSWRGEGDVNSRSLGIELVNPGHEFGYRPFPEAQVSALVGLCRGILARHPIPPRHVLGHSDVAPARKQDPGELFDWARLAAAGIGLWPERRPVLAEPLTPSPSKGEGRGGGGAGLGKGEPAGAAPPAPAEVRAMLARFGYDVGAGADDAAATRLALAAFQRHFRPWRVDGEPDAETAARLRALLALAGE